MGQVKPGNDTAIENQINWFYRGWIPPAANNSPEAKCFSSNHIVGTYVQWSMSQSLTKLGQYYETLKPMRIALPKSFTKSWVRRKLSPDVQSSAISTPWGHAALTAASQQGSLESMVTSTPFARIASCLLGDAKPTTRTFGMLLANWVAAQPTPPIHGTLVARIAF